MSPRETENPADTAYELLLELGLDPDSIDMDAFMRLSRDIGWHESKWNPKHGFGL